MKETILELTKCKTCGKDFLRTDPSKQHCRICSKAWFESKQYEKEQADTLKWEEKKKEENALFEEEIKKHPIVDLADIQLSHPLYIIGNGFDLMHRVKSSYYSFRDSIGKRSGLRETLEMTLTVDEIWADFEEALGHLNMDLMGGRHIVDMWLDDFGFFSDEDAGAAEFYAAIETAANPIITIVNELQPAFRRWVETLNVGTDDRPLMNLIKTDGKFLCFNYTEFVETMYGAEDVCYIHGCRKNKKEPLILGHRPGMVSYLDEKNRNPKTYHQAVVDVAQENVLDLIGQYDEDLTKNSQELIKKKRGFFDGLTEIDQIIVIGHSVSPVDWDYFREVNSPEVCWYFGSHGLNDLRNIEALIRELSIEDYKIFRTDGIRTESNGTEVVKSYPKTPQVKRFNGNGITVEIQSFNMKIKHEQDALLEIILPNAIKQVVLLEDHIFMVDLDDNILLFNEYGGVWRFVSQLTGFEYQSLLNRRLNHIFVTEKEIKFIYNNRIRVYDLETGKMINNQAVRDARKMNYSGKDVMEQFVRR